jgi:hypothetical protein
LPTVIFNRLAAIARKAHRDACKTRHPGNAASRPRRHAPEVKVAMTDYWLSKLFFDLQQDPKLAAEYRADMAAVIDRYEIKPHLRKALLADDVGTLAPLVNAYLLRFYFQVRGMPEAEFISRLHALKAKEGTAHG